MTYTPWSSMASAIRAASAASPNMTGTIACSPGSSSKPSSPIRARNSSALRNRVARSSALPSTSCSAVSVAAVIEGASELENRYGRPFWRSIATISRLPET